VLRREWNSIKAAGHGLFVFFRSESHGVVHLIATLIVIILGLLCNIDRHEWIALLLAIGLVIVSEVLNTAIEKLSDVVEAQHHPGIGLVKDIAAGAVLFASFIALVVGMFVFIPHLLP